MGDGREDRVRAAAPGRRASERGQALPLALGGVFALLAGALALVAIAGAVTGKGRGQRAADLAAISAARSMRDDLPRLLAPPTMPDGLPNPRHLTKSAYLWRARAAAREAAAANGVAAARLRVSFPDRGSFAPLRARAVVVGRIDLGADGEDGAVPDGSAGARRGERPRLLPQRRDARWGLGAGSAGGTVEAAAVAEAGAPVSASGQGAMPATASGGGYDGPLVYRGGEGMRPDVGAAFDRMATAAARAGLTLTVSSGFRSDAEQAALFAAHPDPRWVAPPGRSLHRCATELDLGPGSAYGWLAANASRFGFVQRYGWEAWHYGYEAGLAPCSAAADAGDGTLAASGGLPGFVPARYRAPILRAAGRWNVPAALLAGQLMAESGFDPAAGSPAGAQGIAQFMPSTAAAYGLRDPYDPAEAIDAEAHLMSDLLRRFGDVSLALAAYNAGPAPVEACDCVPDYPETRAYVARILALLDGAAALATPTIEVRLIS